MGNNNENARVDKEKYVWQVKVRSAAHLDCWIEEYFDGLTVNHQSDGTTLVRGNLPDRPALYGFVLKLRDAGVDLLSLQAKKQQKPIDDLYYG